MSKRGFTLIELLVVVLIIGILSAVALPQYNAAAERSRLAMVQSNVKYGKEILEMFWMSNGSYPAALSETDFEIPGCSFSDSGMVIDCSNYYYHYLGRGLAGVVRLEGHGYSSVYYQGLDHGEEAGAVQCWAQADNQYANRACKAMGGMSPTSPSASNWIKYTLSDSNSTKE